MRPPASRRDGAVGLARHGRRLQLAAGWRLATAVGAGLVLALAAVGCGEARPSSSPPVPQDPGVIHVHGLGINPRDGALYAATHTG